MSFLRATGSALPERVVTNDELAPLVGESAEWILSSTGMRERRYAADGEGVADLAVRAAERCLEHAGVAASELGMLLVSSGSAERQSPGPAGAVAARLGLTSTPALDIAVPSAGSLIALAQAMHLAPAVGKVLVVASEIMSRRIDRTPEGKNTAVLFGDGAGAALIDPEQGLLRLADASLFTDGTAADVLYTDTARPGGPRLVMDGGSVILRASRKLPGSIADLLTRHGIAAPDVAQFLVHQANGNLLTRVAATLKAPPERFFRNVERYGNTSSASLLIAADEWLASLGGAPASGPVVFSAFGAGLNWGALLALPA